MSRRYVVALIFAGALSGFASEPQLRSCQVQVSMANGMPVPRTLELQLFHNQDRLFKSRVPADGNVELPALAVGEYRVQTDGAGKNFVISGPLHVAATGPCLLGVHVEGRADARQRVVEEDDVDVEDLRISPETRHLFEQAFADFRQGELQRARQRFIEVTRLAPRLSRAFDVLGVIADQQGDCKAARQYFERALELNPRRKSALMNLAKLSMIEKQYEQAISLLERYRIGTREIADVHALEADAYLELHKYREAIREAHATHLLAHMNWDSTHIIAAKAYTALGEIALATAEYREYMEETSNPTLKQAAAKTIEELGKQQGKTYVPSSSLLPR